MKIVTPPFVPIKVEMLRGVKDVKQYVFVNYHKKMYFSDPRNQSVVQNPYNNLIAKNKRDTHQRHTNTFEIEGLEPDVGFCMQGTSPHNSIVFYVWYFWIWLCHMRFFWKDLSRGTQSTF